MKLSEKFKAIRIAEGLSQTQFCKIIGLSDNTLQKYESGSYEPSGLNLIKLTQHPRFEKYTLWLMTNKVAPSAGQIAPALAHYGTDGEEAQKRTRKTGKNSDVRSSHYDQKTG